MYSRKPSVFISYSWDDEDHRKWVSNLANRLSSEGFIVNIDSDISFGDHIVNFMEQGIGGSDFIISVLTPKYANKANNREGGVGFEQRIISSAIYNKEKIGRIIPILRSGNISGNFKSIPTSMDGMMFIDFRSDEIFNEKFRLLKEDLIKKFYFLMENEKSLKSSEDTYNFRLEKDLKIEKVELFNKEIYRIIKDVQLGYIGTLEISIKEVDAWRELLRKLEIKQDLDDSEMAEAMKIKNLLDKVDMKGKQLNLLIAEAIGIICKLIANRNIYVETPEEIRSIIQNTLSLFSFQGPRKHLMSLEAPVDAVLLGDQDIYFRFYLGDSDFKEMTDSNYPIKSLSHLWQLEDVKAADLSNNVYNLRFLPYLVYYTIAFKYEYGIKLPQENALFSRFNWSIGPS